jgi:hypothetical protein
MTLPKRGPQRRIGNTAPLSVHSPMSRRPSQEGHAVFYLNPTHRLHLQMAADHICSEIVRRIGGLPAILGRAP